MNTEFHARPIWAGVALRLTEGTLMTVELDRLIVAHLSVTVDEQPYATLGDPRIHYTSEGMALHYDFHVTGIGRQVTRLDDDYGKYLKRDRSLERAESQRRLEAS